MSTTNLSIHTRGGRALLDVIEPHSPNIEQGDREIFHLVSDLQEGGWAALDTSLRHTGQRNAVHSHEEAERFPLTPGPAGVSRKKETQCLSCIAKCSARTGAKASPMHPLMMSERI